MYKLANYLALVGFCLLFPWPACPQATVNETLETTILYVDGAGGSDSNSGSQAQPLKTIGKAAAIALDNKKLNLGTKVVIAPGTYRETLTLTGFAAQSPLPVTFQAATPGTVNISGAERFSDWTSYSGNSDIYVSPWPHQWGFCAAYGNAAPYEQPIVLRREILVVNGVALTQVLSLAQMLFPGTFFVDEAHGKVYIWPPNGTNMNAADVEVASNSPLVTLRGLYGINLNGIVFRGINFVYANSCQNEGAVYVYGTVTNVLFDTDSFQWNNGQGISLNHPASNLTVLNCTANHNGATGYQAYRLRDVLWKNDEASYNNWRGAQGAYYNWNMGGYHLFSDHNETISGGGAAFNQTFGIHWDTDSHDTQVDSFLSAQNILGVLFEKNEGPLTVTNSYFCSTSAMINGYAGFALRNSQNATLSKNVFYGNNMSEILVTGVEGGLEVSNWETGDQYNLITQNINLTGNIIEGYGSQSVFHDSYLGGTDWTAFVSSLSSDNNTWWNPSAANTFVLPSPKFGSVVDFAEWQATTGQDAHSTWAAPETNPPAECAITADSPDFWLVTPEDSQTIDDSGHVSFPLVTTSLANLSGTVTLLTDAASVIPGASAAFSPATVPTQGNSVLTIATSGSTPAGTYNFTVLANTGNVTRTVMLQAVVVKRAVRLSTANLFFNNQPVEGTSAGQTVNLTNTGTAVLTISRISVPTGFAQTNNCSPSVGVGETCSITVTFAPHTLTTYNGVLTIVDSDPSSPQTVNLAGTTVGSPKVSVTPNFIGFGHVIYGNTSNPLTVTLLNHGSAALSIHSITLSGASAPEFNATNNCGPTLAIGSQCEVNITFAPAADGQQTASLNISDNEGANPQTFTVTGDGISAVNVSPSSLSFAPVKVGSRPSGSLL